MTLRPALPDYKVRPGDIILVPFAGPIGWVITLLQAVVAWTPSPYSHAEVYVGNGMCVGARAPRASKVRLEDVLARPKVAILAVPESCEWQRDLIVGAALSMVGARYQYLAYLWIGLSRLPIGHGAAYRMVMRWLQHRLETDRAWICSALADRAWYLAGVHLFGDGRLLGAVTPGQLARVGQVRHLRTGPWIEDGTGVD
jgi:hypothetical protein